MSNRSSNYWGKRTIQRLIFSEKQSEVYINRIKAMYSKAEKNIQEMIDNVYKNYSKETGLDVQTLKELLTKSESKKIWDEMKKQGLDQYVKNNYKSRITRLERLQMQVYSKAKELYNKERLTSTELYKKILKNNYYRGIYDIQTGVGLNFSFAKLDENTIKALLQDNWSGKNYSERIWGNTDILAESLSEELGGAILSGQGVEKTASRIRDRFGVAKYYATRLVRTETNHFHAEADFMAYEEMGIDKYVFVATLDNRTSTICQELDGKIFNVKDKAEGVNCPPMHPNCRSTTRAYLDDIAERRMTRRARDPVTGETSVIGNKTYKEWYQDNVAKYGQDVVDKAYKRKSSIPNKKKEAINFKKALGKAKLTVDEVDRWRVDSTHSVENYIKDKLMVTKGGSTFAITPDCDIISVCRNGNDTLRGKNLMELAVKNGGIKLDSYDGNYGFYRKCGFEPVSWTKFDKQYAPDGWVEGRDDEEDIVFFKYTGEKSKLSINELKEELEEFKKNTIQKAYEEAMKERDDKL